MWRGGDSRAGFEVSIDRLRRVLRFRFWGLWEEPLGRAFRDTALAGMHQLGRAHAWMVLADISKYPPQKPEVQKFHAELMSKAPALGCVRAANLVDNAVSALQIRRLSEESGLPDFSFFRSEAEALKWLGEAERSSGVHARANDGDPQGPSSSPQK